jgi:formate dehydrogenase maturation protein FdhE
VPTVAADPRKLRATFERRAARAAALAPGSAAEAPLAFAAGLFRVQGVVAERLVAAGGLVGQLEADLPRLLGTLAPIIEHAAELGPPGLAAAARADDAAAAETLLSWWRGRRSGQDGFLTRALLRPYVEALAALGVAPESGAPGDAACSFCGGLPWVAARLPLVAGDGARRVTCCALCGRDQSIARATCPACGETRSDELPFFSSDRYPAARIEACATCRRYVKSIDLTIDGRAVPEVDDLASLALDLWAAEEGYARIEPGLAGI